MEIRKIKILAIDDNPDNLISLKALIREAFPEATVFTAISGKRGLELSIQEDPDVILLDIVMPEMDGFEVCRKLKTDPRLCDIPVVFVTALKGDQESRIKALECGGEAFLAKPIDESELTAQIRAMVKIKTANTDKRNENERLKRLVEERTNELVQSQAQFKGIFENLQDAYFQADISGIFTLASPSALKMFGYRSLDEIIGQPANSFYADPKERDSLIVELRSKRRIEDFVCRARRKDGSIFWASMNVQLLCNIDGQIYGTEGLVRDISERQKAEQQLKESEERFRHISSSISDISYSCETDLSGNSTINWLYGATEEITGYTPEELIAMKCWGKLVIDEDFPFFKSHILGVIPGCSDECELRIRKKDGSMVWLQASAECTKGPVGSIFNILYGGLVDITRDKIIEQALKESEALYHSFIQQLPNPVFRKDFEGRYILANSQFLKLKGLSEKELIGLTPLEVAAREIAVYGDQELATQYALVGQDLHEQIMRTGKIFESEEVYDNHSDGTKWYMHVMRMPVIDSYGNIIGTQGIMFDISKRKLAEEALLESEAKFRELFEKAADAIFIAEIGSGFIVDANEAASRLMLRPYNELVGIHQSQLHPPVKENYSKDTFKEHKELVKQKVDSHAIENTVLRTDGTEVPVEILASAVDYNGKSCVMGTFRDITERKHAEDKLHENVARLELAMSTANMSWWEMDMTTGQVIFEKRKAEMLGYAPEEFKHYSDFMALVHPEDREHTMDAMRLHLNGSMNKYEVEYRIKTISGEYKWYYDIGSVTKRDAEGRPLLVSGLVLNITERKEAENLLQESEYFFKESQRAAYVGSYKFDIVDDHWTASEVLEQIFGIDKSYNKTLQSWLKIIHPDDREMMAKYFSEEVVGKRQPFNKEYQIISQSDHEIRWVHGLGKLKFDTEGNAIEMIGTIQDITERKLTEKARNESYEFNRSLLKTIPFGMDIVDEHGNILFQSDNLENVFGKKAMGCKCWDLYSDDKIQCRNCPLKKGIEIGKTETYESSGILGGRIFEISHTGMMFKGKKAMLEIFQDITDRKQAEVELMESKDRYKQFISQVSEGVYRFESDQPMNLDLPIEEQVDFIYDHMLIAECNDAFVKMYGVTDKSEVIGKGHLDFHGGRYNEINRGVIRSFIRNGYRTENEVTEEFGARGQKIIFSNNSLGIVENNQLIRMWGTQTDITEKVRADQVQRVLYEISNAALSSINLSELIEIISNQIGKLLDSSNFYIAYYDEANGMLSTHYERDKYDQIESWPAEKSLTGYVIKNKKSLLASAEEINKLYEAGEIELIGTVSKIWLGVPLYVKRKVIGAIVVQSYDNPNAFTEKEKLMLEFVSHQISTSIERKKIEQDLRLMGKVFDQSPLTIVITDRKGDIQYVNPKFTESTGYTQEEVKGNNPRLLKSGHQSNEYYKNLWETILAGNDWFGEMQNKRKNGELYWESAVISPITNEGGDIEFLLAIKEDITDKKRMIDDLVTAKEKAQESDRLKSAFLANMSHEIRTPLNSIIGFSELLLDPDFDQEQHDEFARMINNSGSGLLSIISDIMDLSKIEAGQVDLKMNYFSVNRLLSDIAKEYSYNAIEKGIELRMAPSNSEEEISIYSDSAKVKQVLINFVSNAIKFTENGSVEVGFRVQNESVLFQVQDTGIGISGEFHSQIFERFRQVEETMTRKYGGNGLGLAISKSLVEMIGGKIGMKSEKGKGSIFYFTIPLDREGLTDNS
ncbi:MAG: PAS domain S-box protein [Prolixibacteraceae bacterium]|nr:PAS domain S-box protein [Prolixibacteraceae bacterium]